MRSHTVGSGVGRRWLTFAACAIAGAAAFGACTDDSTPPTAPSQPSFAAGGAVSVDLDQCANLSTPFCSWQNGDLNGNNSAFAEGHVVPFRLAVEGLAAGTHTIHLNYDFTAGGNEGYDFLATYNATETVDLCGTGGGGVSSLCPLGTPDDVEAFPADGFAVPDANNLTVNGAIAAALFGVGTNRNLSIWGGSITSITALTHAGPTGGNSSVDLTVTFTSNGSAVLLAWGAHLAQSNFWKEGTADDGASVISGAPWHMRTQSLDGSGGNKNQDRSIQPSAIIDLAPAVTIVKKTNGTDNNTAPGPTVAVGSTVTWTYAVTNSGNTALTNVVVTDDKIANDATDIVCPGATTPKNVIASLAIGATVTCTATGTATAGQYTNIGTASDGNVSDTDPDNYFGASPALTIQKTATNSTISAGSEAKYTIVVTSTGGIAANSVALSDQLLNTLSWSVDGTPSGWDSCSISVGQLLTCSAATLAVSATATVTVKATVPSSFVFQTPVATGTSVAIDGNLIEDTADDWATPPTNTKGGVLSCVNPIVDCSLDASGKTDNSFGQGTKEDTPVPTIVSGAIPPNKSDLTRFYITYNRKAVGTAVHDFVYLAWERVQNPSGTTNMDFELNQSSTPSDNGVTPVRTPGDVLIKYDLSSGGDNLSMGYHVWVTSGACESSGSASVASPCWGPLHSLAGAFQGDANDGGTVDDPLAPNATRTLDILTFGEASIDMQLAGIFTAGQCTSFGSAYLKSRSSDSFTAAIKDFVAPTAISLTNCQPATISNTASVSATSVSAQSSGPIVITVNP